VHATDATNASRTMLYDIRRQTWDDELLALLNIPAGILPEVRPCDAWFGETDGALLGRPIPVAGMAGDQQAATVGQACLREGMMKSTYGTGCFALLNTGETAPTSRNRLLTTIGYRLGDKTVYALEGSIFVAGAAVQWLRDGLGLVRTAAQTEELARRADPDSGVYMVPAFVGLGAPYWDSGARGALLGLTRGSGPAEIAAATLDAVAYQTRDLMEAMAADRANVRDGGGMQALRVDGGMVANDWFLQRLADLMGVPVERPEVTETTALGAAYLAGMTTGVIDGEAGIADTWRLDARFEPRMPARERESRYAGWVAAVNRVRSDGG
jgi:glycerol kinase